MEFDEFLFTWMKDMLWMSMFSSWIEQHIGVLANVLWNWLSYGKYLWDSFLELVGHLCIWPHVDPQIYEHNYDVLE